LPKLLKFVAYQPHQFYQITCASKHQVEKLKRWCNVHCLENIQPINAFVDAVFTLIFVPFENQTYQCSQWSVFLQDVFSFKFVVY